MVPRFMLQIAVTIFFDDAEEVGEFVVPALLLTNFEMIPWSYAPAEPCGTAQEGIGDQLVI